MSMFLKQLRELRDSENPNLDFRLRTERFIELLKLYREENLDKLSKKDLAKYNWYITIAEEEYKDSLAWYPIDKIKEGLEKIKNDPEFKNVYPEWEELILSLFEAFASAKFTTNVVRRMFPSRDKSKYGSGLAAKFTFLNKIFRIKNSKKGTFLNKNDVHQIIQADKLSYKLTELGNDSVRSLLKNGTPISTSMADKIIDFFIKHLLGFNMDVIQKGIFNGIIDAVGTTKLDNKTGKESVTNKCRLLWFVFEHTHGTLRHNAGRGARGVDDLNKDVLLKIIQPKRRKILFV